MAKRKKRRMTKSGKTVILFFAVILIFVLALVFRKADKAVEEPREENETVQAPTKLPENDPEELPEDEPKDEPKDDGTRLTFVAVGDNIIHSAVYEDAMRLASVSEYDGDYYFDPIYENFADTFKNADITFVNQETMIAGDDFAIAGYPNFNSPAEIGDTLARLGVDVVNIASNHSYDWRGRGLLNCINYFESSPITAIGAYKDKEDYENIRIIEKEGVKIAFLSYTYGTNGYTAGAGYESLVVPLIDNAEIARQVKRAKDVADLVFVSMHWGIEGSTDYFGTSYDQRESAQAIVDAGADLIIGHHPHVIQEVKWKDRQDGGKTLIAYSLGNFLSTMHYPRNMFGGLLSLEIVKDEEGVRLENPLFVPTMTHYSKSRDRLKLYFLEDYSEELYNTHGTTLKDGSWSYEKIVNKVKEVIPSEFLPEYYK